MLKLKRIQRCPAAWCPWANTRDNVCALAACMEPRRQQQAFESLVRKKRQAQEGRRKRQHDQCGKNGVSEPVPRDRPAD